MRKIAGLAALLLTTIPVPSEAQSDREQVLATIQAFSEALKNKDTLAMAASLDSVSRMTLLRPNPNGGVRVFVLSGREFIRQTTMPNQPANEEPIRNPIVQVDADLASVWAEYQVRRDGRVTHCGYDSFQLARLSGKWKIINVSDSFRQSGCGEPWK